MSGLGHGGEPHITICQGQVMRVAVVDSWPWFELKTAADGSLVPDSGIDHNILNVLAAGLNFRYC